MNPEKVCKPYGYTYDEKAGIQIMIEKLKIDNPMDVFCQKGEVALTVFIKNNWSAGLHKGNRKCVFKHLYCLPDTPGEKEKSTRPH